MTNFFEIEYDCSGRPVGATGGGYILSKGTISSVVGSSKPGVATRVNGDSAYNARTTRRALDLMLSDLRSNGGLTIDQSVEIPIGAGFGASGASATSAVYAAAAAMGVSRKKKDLAIYAHRAEILEQTGLGTVSVVFNHVGAGAITRPGEPGVAEFLRVKVPRDIRIVSAYLAPFDKKDAFSNEAVSERINRFGKDSLAALVADPTLDNLGTQGERFSGRVGLESPEVKKLIRAAKSAGALYASQNMIGYSIHSVVSVETSKKVSAAIRAVSNEVRVDVFEVGMKRARVLAD